MTTIYPLIMGRRAILATEHYLSAAAGAGIFARGGNAIDAAVAATFVEGVVNPHMHTIGGEAPMLIYSASARRVVAINGNMMAPARATIEHYRSLGLELIPGAGLLAAGVPAAFAFETMTSARVGFTTASLAFGPGEGVCASANCVPSSVFTSTPGIGLGSIAGTDDSV